MSRIQRVLALCLLTLPGALLATPAHAASVVVQDRFVGSDLIAHRYEAPATGNETLTVVARKAPDHNAMGWNSITLLDFDRDGNADASVELYDSDGTPGGPITYRIRKDFPTVVADAPHDGDHCVALNQGTYVSPPGAHILPLTSRPNSDAVVLSLDFDTYFGGVARYQPIMTTVWTANARTVSLSSPIDDYLPDAAAGPAAGHHGTVCDADPGGGFSDGFVVEMAHGSDRELSNALTPDDQTMPDRQEMGAGQADLVSARMQRWIADRQPGDMTSETPPSGGLTAYNPVDARLTFAPGSPRTSTTYLTAVTGAAAPFALLRTSDGPDADHVRVQLQGGLSGLPATGDPDTTADPKCYPRDAGVQIDDGTPGGRAWGPASDRVTFDLPVTRDAQGRVEVRVALDRLLGVFADAGTGNRTQFSWVAATRPAAGDPDYAPDFAGQDFTHRFSACTFTGPDGSTDGTILNPGTEPILRGGAFDATLTLDPPAPERNQSVTLHAGPAVGGAFTNYYFDLNADGLPDEQDDLHRYSSSRTRKYTEKTPATVVVRSTDGVYGVAFVDVTPRNPPPVARLSSDAQPPFRLGAVGATVTWTDGSSDDRGAIKTRTWTLRRDGAAVAGGNAPEFRHTFSDGDAGHWTLELTVTDQEDAPGTTTQEFDVLPDDGSAGSGPTAAALALLTPGRLYAKRDITFSAARSTARVGPVSFAWDLDGDGAFETDSGRQATLTTQYAGPGHRDVRVRLTDGAGAVSVSDAAGIDVAPAQDQTPTLVVNAPESVTLQNGSATAALDATGSRGRNEDPSLAFEWDLDGDGIYETGTGAVPRATARLTTPGDHVVRVRASDVFGNRAVVTKTIFARGSAEIAANCVGREQFRAVSYGPARASACWTKVDRPSSGPLWVARGDVGLNGLRLTRGASRAGAPNRVFADCAGACTALQSLFNDSGQGLRIAFDPNDGTLRSNGAVAISARGSGVDLKLNDGPLDLTLPATASKDEDGIILHPPGGAALLSLKLADEAEVRFPRAGEATVAMTVALPPQMPGAGGDVTLRATEADGIIVDHLKIEVQTGLLSDYLKLADLSVEYDREDQQWTGHAELGLPGIKGKEFGITVEIVIANGRFKSIFGEVDGLAIPLGEGIFLQRIRAGVGVEPLDLQGGLGISAGPKIAGIQLFSADGDLRVTFPSQKYPFAVFQLAGVTKVLDQLELQRGILRFATNGFFEARGQMNRYFGLGYLTADIGGWFTVDKVNLSGNAEAGINFLGGKVKLAEAHAVLSTKGVAACGEIPVIKVGGGVGYLWNQKVAVFTGCDLGPYSEARPVGIPDGFEVRAAAATAPAVKLGPGLRSATIAVHGRGAPPKVKLVDGQGRTVVDATSEQLTTKAFVVFDATSSTTQIVWKAPPKGRYLVVPADGSNAIAKVEQAVDAGPQRVRATVSRSGARRTLRWTVTPRLQRGQQLTLAEAAAVDGPGDEITTTGRSTGTVTFTPREGQGERRVVTSTIVTDGLGRPPKVAARFTAPRTARPAAPRGLEVRRSGRAVTVSWARAVPAPAGGWRVAVEAGSLRRVRTIVGGAKHAFTVDEVPAATPVTAEVAGLGSGRTAGRAATAKLAAGAPRSGMSAAATAVPRGLTARRQGSKLVVRWRPGATRARGFAVTVTAGAGKRVRLHAGPGGRSVTLAGLPKGRVAVRVELRAERFGGGVSAPVVLSGRR